MGGVCKSWEEAEKLRDEAAAKKERKKKKKQKGNSAQKEEEGDIKRVIFPWYHLLFPISLAVVVYRYVKLDTLASIGVVFAIVAMGLIGQKKLNQGPGPSY